MRRLYCLVFSLLFFYSIAFGQENVKTSSPIFQHTDQQGRIVFSNRPDSDYAESIALPEIGKENLDERIEDIKKATPISCEKHGGISCGLGEDEDGSVVCLDGFKDAELKFKFLCLEAKLKIVSLYLKDENGEVYELDEKLRFTQQANQTRAVALLVSVYNTADVEASDVQIKIRRRRIEYIQASGLMNVKPYEVQDYLFPVSELLTVAKLKNLTRGMIYLFCQNCR